MRILIVAFYYPPISNTGARRVGGTAEHLARLGHDVRVLTGLTRASRNMPKGGSAVKTLRTRWLGPPLPHEWIASGGQPAHDPSNVRWVTASRVRSAVRAIYRSCIYLPDPYVGWQPFAIASAKPHLHEWHPDVVYSSAYPLTSIMVGQHLAEHCTAPHVVEMRDLWTDNPYRPRPAWARNLDRALEQRYLSRAAGLVTVSENLAETLRAKYSAPVTTVYHGFEARGPAASNASWTRTDTCARNHLRLVYTGSLHDGRRDPLPLLRAIAKLQREGVSIGFDYYGPDEHIMSDKASRCGSIVGVRCMGVVSNRRALEAQATADILVLLMWNDPREAGSVTGKLFEYIGATKPVLVVGAVHSAAAQIVTTHHLGHAATTEDDVVRWLRDAAMRKRTGDPIVPDLGHVQDFSRERQIERLSSFLAVCVDRAAERAPQ